MNIQNMMRLIGLLFITIIVSSCEYQNTYTYELWNQSSEYVTAYYTSIDKIDTITLNAGSKETLLAINVIESNKNPQQSPITDVIFEMKLLKNDSLISPKPVLQDSLWNFFLGSYQLRVEDYYFDQ